jgi:hypothetical protein
MDIIFFESATNFDFNSSISVSAAFNLLFNFFSSVSNLIAEVMVGDVAWTGEDEVAAVGGWVSHRIETLGDLLKEYPINGIWHGAKVRSRDVFAVTSLAAGSASSSRTSKKLETSSSDCNWGKNGAVSDYQYLGYSGCATYAPKVCRNQFW